MRYESERVSAIKGWEARARMAAEREVVNFMGVEG
jgi:hypothetical protein